MALLRYSDPRLLAGRGVRRSLKIACVSLGSLKSNTLPLLPASHLDFCTSKRSRYPQTPSTVPSATRTRTITTPERCELSKSDLIGGGSNKIAVIPRATQVNNFQSITAFMYCVHVSTLYQPGDEPSVTVSGSPAMGMVRRHAGCPSKRRFASGRFRACISHSCQHTHHQ
jgi:hypothetical protein